MIFFIDPMSYNNLAIYDYNLLENNKDFKIVFFGNSSYSYKPLTRVTFKPIYNYNKFANPYMKFLSYFISITRLTYYIFILKPRVLHIQWIRLWVLDYYWLKFVKLFCKTKVVYTAHNILPHNTGNRHYNNYCKYYNLVEIIITHSVKSKNELIDTFYLSNKKIFVIPHGPLNHDVEPQQVDNEVKKLKKRILKESNLVFTLLGTQSSYKGSDIVADVWAGIPEIYANEKISLLVFGKHVDVDFSVIKDFNNVIIENRFISDEEFVAILRMTDVLLLPYRAISQSGVLFSAINENVPVVVTNAGGLSEPLQVADIGWNIGNASINNLKDLLVKLINDPLCVELKKNNLKGWMKIHNYYNWTEISKKTFQLYNSL